MQLTMLEQSCRMSGFALQAAFVEPEDDGPENMSRELSFPQPLKDVLSSAVLDTKLLRSQVGSPAAVDGPLR